MKTQCAFFWLILFSFTIKGQLFNYYHYNFTTDNGLPSNTVYALIEDKKGAFFICHEDGISRYNGNKFEHFKNPGKGKSLSYPVETNNGDILSTSFYGDLVKLSKNKVSLLSQKLKNKSNRISFRKFGDRIFMYSQNQLFEYVQNSFQEIKINRDKNDEIWILDIYADKQNQIYVLSALNNKSTLITLDAQFKITQTKELPFAISNKSNIIEIETKLYVYLIESNTFYPINKKAEKSYISPLIFDNKSEKWLRAFRLDENHFCINGYNGLLIFNNAGKQIAHLLNGVQVSGAIKDREGNIWVSTLNEGIYIFPSLNILELKLEEYIGKHDFIKSTKFINQQVLLLGTNKGKLIKINTETGQLWQFNHDVKGDVQTIQYDSVNKLIYTFCDGIYVIQEKGLTLVKKLKVTSTKAIYVNDTQLFFGTSSGLIELFQNKENTFFEGNWINSILPIQKDSVLLLGSNKGLMKLDLKNRKEEYLNVNIPKFEKSMVTHLQNDASGSVYLLANNLGIIKSNDYKNYSLVIENSNIRDFKINKNKIYIINKDKVDIYNLNDFVREYNLDKTKGMDDNILDVEMNEEYFIVVHPKKIKRFNKLLSKNIIAPYIYIRTISGTYQILSDSTYFSDYKNNLEFELEILPNIRSRNTFTLYYRVKELDGEWVKYNDELKEFKFKYQQINSGSYHFEAYAINEDGLKSEVFEFNFSVEAPYWKKWWFITLMIGVFLTGTLAIYFRRIKSIQKLSREKIESQNTKIKLLSAELTAIRSQMNPHFIFNTLSSIQAKVMMAKGDEASHDIALFSHLIRSVLNYSSKEYIILANEIEFIKNYLYLESSRFDGNIHYEINIDPVIDIHFLEIPTLITIPFIENAIIHGLLHSNNEKKLTISFTEVDSFLEIKIRDNGIGRKKAGELHEKSGKKHKSFATAATAKRIERINETGHMKIELFINDLNEGTEIKMTINYI
jgi:ligand-binding sensor domain-containing protein